MKKRLQEATGAARYIMNTPGPMTNLPFWSDPQMRLQGWGGNLHSVPNGHPVDIDSYLTGLTRPCARNATCVDVFSSENPYLQNIRTVYNPARENTSTLVQETRATHPAWALRDIEYLRYDFPLFNPQERIERPFANNLEARRIARDEYEGAQVLSSGVSRVDPRPMNL